MRKHNLYHKLYINLDALRMAVSKLGLFNALKVIIAEYSFDMINRVDTMTAIDRRELASESSSDNTCKMNNYRPSLTAWVDESLKKIENRINFTNSNFVDMGSGKGKVLFVAEKYNFLKIKGIEYSETLHNICVNNIATLKLNDRVDSFCIDGTKYIPEKLDSVIYFFNPFRGELLRASLENITNSGISPIYLIAVSPTEGSEGVEIFDLYAKRIEEYNTAIGGARVIIYEVKTKSN